MTLQQLKSDIPGKNRQEQILDLAAIVFAEHGYKNTDVQEIADRLGIGKGTVYRHYGSKEKLFLSAVDWGMRQLDRKLKGIRDAEWEDPLECIRAIVHAYLAFFDAHPQFVELFILERAEFKNRKKPTYFEYRDANAVEWQNAAEALMAKGRLRAVPILRIMEVISNVLYGTIFTNAFSGKDRTMEAQAEAILDIVFNGILYPAQPKSEKDQS